MVEGCGTASIERKLKSFTSDMEIGFVLDAAMNDLSHLLEYKTHSIAEEKRKGIYQKVLDVCIKNRVNHDALGYLTEIRDEKVSPEPVIKYVFHELSALNDKYLSRSQQTLREGLFKS